MGHRRLYNHHRHDRSSSNKTKIAGLIEDIHGQTAKLRDAVESASPAPPPPPPPPPPHSTPADQLHNLRVVAAALQLVIDDIASGPTGQRAPTPQAPQTPVPQPDPDPPRHPQPDPHPRPQPEPDPEHKKPHPHPKPAPQPAPQPQQPPSGIAWPSFTGTDALVGHSPSGMVSVYVDASLGNEAQQNATDLLADADRVVGINNALFGKTQTVPVRVLLFAMGATDGTGGADHMGCDYATGGDIEVCVAYGDSSRCSGLFEAELSECAMNNQLCGLSTGEALSRWCAAIASNNSLADFATAPEWAQDGYPDWVSRTESTDQGMDSIGCGMAFISYLLHRGATLPAIAQAMVRLGDAGTLADLYAALKMGTVTQAWATFSLTVKALGALTSDDPFAQVAMAMRQHEHI